MPDRGNRHLSGCDRSATDQRLGAYRLRELVAARGDVGLWLADHDDDGASLLRLFPGPPTLDEWRTFQLAASETLQARDERLVPIAEIALDVWPHMRFDCADAESLARRIAREPMTPTAAVAMCADVATALTALGRAGVPPVDLGPADVVLDGQRARLLADVGLPRGELGETCVDFDHVAPERAAAIADRARGVRASRRDDGDPTDASMAFALASIASAAIRGPGAGGDGPAALPARLERVLRRGLAPSPPDRYGTPAALAEALGDAIGVPVSHAAAEAPPAAPAPAAVRAPAAPTALPRRRARPRRRRYGVAIPAGAVLVAAAIGIGAGSATTVPDPPAAATLAGGGLSLEAPQGWLRGGPGDGVPAFGEPVLVAHPAARSSVLALVVTRDSAPLLARLEDTTPEPVRLGDNGAWRYRDVAIESERVADVYVLEDGEGTIVAGCLGPSDAPASARSRCSTALTTLQLHAGPAVALGGDAAARRELARVVADLDRTRAKERGALADAATGRGQAAAADRLAAAYAHAAADAGRSGTVGAPGALRRLVDRLDETGEAYAALATAARAERRAAYAQARDRVAAREDALREDLAALGAARSSL